MTWIPAGAIVIGALAAPLAERYLYAKSNSDYFAKVEGAVGKGGVPVYERRLPWAAALFVGGPLVALFFATLPQVPLLASAALCFFISLIATMSLSRALLVYVRGRPAEQSQQDGR